MIKIFTFIIVGCLVSFAMSKTSYGGDKERYRVYNPWERLGELSALIDNDFDSHRNRNEVDVYINQNTFDVLVQKGFKVEKMRNEALEYHQWLLQNSPKDNPLLEYHDYNELTQFLQDYSIRFPNITRLFSIGRSVQGRELWGIQITDNPQINEQGEPKFQYIANMHGDETVGRELLLELVALLCNSYGINQTLTNLVDTTDIYIIPSMNPDGFERASRYNGNNADLNRDFPDQFTDPNNSPIGREPETAAVMAWVQEKNFVFGGNFHGGATCVNYPYDGLANQGQCGRSISRTPDHDLYIDLSLTYSKFNQPMYESRSFENGITNGAEWYCLYGGMQDWNYVWNGGLHTTLEISDVKYPPAGQLAGFWEDNRDSMLAYLQKSHIGVKGRVLDRSTGMPVQATIEVQSARGFYVYTDKDDGDYFRLLLPGTYQITATPTGRSPVTQQAVVRDGAVTILDFYV